MNMINIIRKNKNKLGKILLLLLFVLSLTACELGDIYDLLEENFLEDQIESDKDTEVDQPTSDKEEALGQQDLLSKDQYYYSLEDVSTYLIEYGVLPNNFITKSQAKKMGWDSKDGNLWEVAPGMVIGGDRFGNREKILPSKEGRIYYECDIDYDGGYRNSKRIVYSNDGLIYYTDDHYESFDKIYGEE